MKRQEAANKEGNHSRISLPVMAINASSIVPVVTVKPEISALTASITGESRHGVLHRNRHAVGGNGVHKFHAVQNGRDLVRIGARERELIGCKTAP